MLVPELLLLCCVRDFGAAQILTSLWRVKDILHSPWFLLLGRELRFLIVERRCCDTFSFAYWVSIQITSLAWLLFLSFIKCVILFVTKPLLNWNSRCSWLQESCIIRPSAWLLEGLDVFWRHTLLNLGAWFGSPWSVWTLDTRLRLWRFLHF